MNLVFAAAESLQRFCEGREWRFCFIGGLAVQHWGEQRITRDVDITLLTGFGGEEVYVDALLGEYQPRIENAREFSLSNRVLLLQTEAGVGLDVALAGLPFEADLISRSKRVAYTKTLNFRICSAEDLIVTKAFAARARDWGDVETIIASQQGKLDWGLIFRELRPLCELKEAPEIPEQLERLRQELDKR